MKDLELVSVTGFNGKVKNGLQVNFNKKGQLLYPLGNSLVVKDVGNDNRHQTQPRQRYLLSPACDNPISCLRVSPSGKYIAAGHQTFMGFKTLVCVWELSGNAQLGSHDLHKVCVAAVAFTAQEDLLVSLGGEDDRSVIIWSMEKREALCGCQSSQGIEGTATSLVCSKIFSKAFVTAGSNTLRVWHVDAANQKVEPEYVHFGHIKRDILCLELDEQDRYCYCGTSSGDILKVNLKLDTRASPVFMYRLVRRKIKGQPNNHCFSRGVTSLAILKTGVLVIGTGDGYLCKATYVDKKRTGEIQLEEIGATKLEGAVTSIVVDEVEEQLYIGTSQSQMYQVQVGDFQFQQLLACHNSSILDIVFPSGCSDLYVTCAVEQVIVWHTQTDNQLLRISLPRLTCAAVHCMHNGHSIVTGWDDGKVRVYKPESGTLWYSIHEAHSKGVSAVSGTRNSQWILSGGGEGQLRVWRASPVRQVLVAAMKEHKGTIVCIQVHSSDTECLTASVDGTCIVWNLQRFTRTQVVFANTLFKSICYGPEECQLITAGSDRQIAYWEVFDGTLIRQLEGFGAINTMDISTDKKHFVSGGTDRTIRMWNYHDGEVVSMGTGHSGVINKLKISPDGRFVVSVSDDGASLRWRLPDEKASSPSLTLCVVKD